MILDFLDNENRNCSYICPERDWYLRFLKNENFKNLYFKRLKEISSLKLVEAFHKKNLDMINFYNNQFLSETSNKDRVFYKGLGLYIFDEDYLFNRSDYIQSRINEIENKLTNIKLINEDNYKGKYLLSKKKIF